MIRNIDQKRRHEQHSELPRHAYEKAKRMLVDPSYSIQSRAFEDLYGKERLVTDKNRVDLKKAAIAAAETPDSVELKKAADVFEAIMLEQSELSEWLGRDVRVLKTAEYDDLFNGIDLLADWSTAAGDFHTLGLAVDVTFGSNAVERKMRKIKELVDKNQLGTIRYFASGDGTIRGERSGIPHVVVGAGRGTVNELARLWTAGEKRRLGAHPVQRALIEEIYFQMSAIRAYAKARRLSKVATAYERSLSMVSKLMSEKNTIEMAEMNSDPVYNEIISASGRIFRT